MTDLYAGLSKRSLNTAELARQVLFSAIFTNRVSRILREPITFVTTEYQRRGREIIFKRKIHDAKMLEKSKNIYAKFTKFTKMFFRATSSRDFVFLIDFSLSFCFQVSPRMEESRSPVARASKRRYISESLTSALFIYDRSICKLIGGFVQAPSPFSPPPGPSRQIRDKPRARIRRIN